MKASGCRLAKLITARQPVTVGVQLPLPAEATRGGALADILPFAGAVGRMGRMQLVDPTPAFTAASRSRQWAENWQITATSGRKHS